MCSDFCVFGRLHLSWNCALVFGDSTTFAFIFLGVDPRIEHVMDCVPREWQMFGIVRSVYFFLVGGDQVDRVAFFLIVAIFAQLHCSSTQ